MDAEDFKVFSQIDNVFEIIKNNYINKQQEQPSKGLPTPRG